MTSSAPQLLDRISCRFPVEQGFHGVGSLVIGGAAARFDLPIDRIDDLVLAVESLFLQGISGEEIVLEIDASPSGLLVHVGPFAEGQIADPAVARVLTPLVDDVSERYDTNGAWVGLFVSAPGSEER